MSYLGHLEVKEEKEVAGINWCSFYIWMKLVGLLLLVIGMLLLIGSSLPEDGASVGQKVQTFFHPSNETDDYDDDDGEVNISIDLKTSSSIC